MSDLTDRRFQNRIRLRTPWPFDDLPPVALTLSAVTSGVTLLATFVLGWPLWGVVLAALVPWLPAITLNAAWMRWHDGWLALFTLLVVTQGGHLVEHVVQVGQIHLLGWPSSQARGVVGQLDIEWVHFLWNSVVLLAMAALTWRFRHEPWLWIALVAAGWHQVEHTYLIAVYLQRGIEGTPGLLAMGGRLGNGVPLSRPDLHFLYNVVETTPLFVAYARIVRQTLATVHARVASPAV